MVVANVRIPSYSELKLMADVSGGVQHNQVYVLKGIKRQSNNVMVAWAVVRAGTCVPVRVLNPFDQVYKDTRITALAEAEESHSPVHVPTVQKIEEASPQVEAALWQLVKGTSLDLKSRISFLFC